ncbi:MAG: ammonium transporter [Mycobacteriales bacterium]|nr:ammonium transporter [Frankia sp.]
MRLRSKLVTAAAAGAAMTFAGAMPAWAGSTDGGGTTVPGGALTHGEISLNLLWIVLGAVLVIFMQAGFALVETGFCRAKHAAHVVSTNFMIFGLGFVAFMAVGFSFMFGGFSYPGYFGYDHAFGHALIGSANHVFLWGGGWFLSGKTYDVSILAFFLYMVAFMDTTATIPTGAMAERWKFKSFVLWGLFCGGLYYPLFGAWTWGGGWLSKLWATAHLGHGYVDFAGSGVVHAMGGAAALAGALVIGPRIGKFGPDGKPRTLQAHHIPMAMLGTFILLFGWFGFNAASTFAATDNRFAVVAANTAIAGAFGSVVAMGWVWWRTGKPDPGMCANGMLAGLVAITAPCAFVQPWAAAVIGTIAGAVVIEAVWLVERRLRIDDPVGAIAVHGVNGLFGVLCVGLFSDGSYGAGWNGRGFDAAGKLVETKGVTGLFYGDAGQLAAQAVAAVVIAVGFTALAYGFFRLQNRLTEGGIRSAEADEVAGLDLPEMGVLAYPEFIPEAITLPEPRREPLPMQVSVSNGSDGSNGIGSNGSNGNGSTGSNGSSLASAGMPPAAHHEP